MISKSGKVHKKKINMTKYSEWFRKIKLEEYNKICESKTRIPLSRNESKKLSKLLRFGFKTILDYKPSRTTMVLKFLKDLILPPFVGKTKSEKIYIAKYEDEWFTINFGHHTFYICDQFDGLVKCIEVDLEIEKFLEKIIKGR